MNNITYYDAGAGSGKTYALTHKLADKMAEEGLKSSEVIMTTFSVKAANDLKERARSVLYEKGLNSEAATFDQATIGTVHSIGQKFIGRFWYLLGLSPDMKVMDENSTDYYVSQSLSSIADKEDIEAFNRFREIFNITKTAEGFNSRPLPYYDYWKDWLKSVIEKCSNFQINSDDLDISCNLSIEKARELFGGNLKFNRERNHYVELLKSMYNADNRGSAAQKKRRLIIEDLCNHNVWNLKEYFELLKFWNSDLPNALKNAIEDFEDELGNLSTIWNSNLVFSEIQNLITRIFNLAKKWLKEYSDYKAERRILDFNDMENYFYELLQLNEIKDEISGTYKCLMVDEFQDSSPLQVKIFDRLSELVESSYWCGDSKQAIYRFRGSDTELTEAVVSMIPNERIIPLNYSRRSVPDIVNFCNSLFVRIFQAYLPKDKVELNTWRPAIEGPSLLHWLSSQNSKGKALEDIGAHVLDFKNNHKDINWCDIAILARTSSDITSIVKSLHKFGIPVNYKGEALLMCQEVQLLQALLTLVTDISNPLAKAKIAFLTAQGFNIVKLIESRLNNLNTCEDEDNESHKYDWLNEIPIIKRLKESISEWSIQNVSSLVITLINELNLRYILKAWDGDWVVRERNLMQVADLAIEYEKFSDLMGLGASIGGFLDYLEQSNVECSGDINGVIVSTMHSSKGLQWPNVVITSLEYDGGKESQIIEKEVFGIHEMHRVPISRDNIFPGMDLLFLPWVFSSYAIPSHIKDKMLESELYKTVRNKAIEESARLLYVAMTRACDRLITFSYRNGGTRSANPMSWLNNFNIETSNPTEAGMTDIFSTGLKMKVTAAVDTESKYENVIEGRENYDKNTLSLEICNFGPRYVSPSKVRNNELANIQIVEERGKRISISGNPNMDKVGDCIHNAYAAFSDDEEYNLKVTNSIIDGFHFSNVITDRSQVVAARRWLKNWLITNYGEILEEFHELPFIRYVNGQIIRGSMDLVVRTSSGLVLIDFKTFPGSVEMVSEGQSPHFAGKYKPQFDCYEDALKQSGERVIAKYVFYPVSGLLVQLID